MFLPLFFTPVPPLAEVVLGPVAALVELGRVLLVVTLWLSARPGLALEDFAALGTRLLLEELMTLEAPNSASTI